MILRMELKSKREAAQMLGVSTRAIERAVRRGQLAVEYRDSKHGRKAWFRSAALNRYREHQEARGTVGFTSGIPGHPPGGPMVGTLIPMVEAGPQRRKGQDQETNPVPVADRLVLTVEDAVRLSGLPRTFIVENIKKGRLKSIAIGKRHYVKRADLNEFVHGL
jgi:excisionase family DNA binding protein